MYQSKAGQSVSYQRTLNVTASMERLQHFSVQTKLPKSLDDSIRAYLAAMDLQNDQIDYSMQLLINRGDFRNAFKSINDIVYEEFAIA